MALFTVTLPSLGEDADDKALVSFVYVNVGDKLEKDQDLLEMVTDKATFNVPCPKAGVLKTLRVSEGDNVKVGDPLCDLEV